MNPLFRFPSDFWVLELAIDWRAWISVTRFNSGELSHGADPLITEHLSGTGT